MNMIHIIVFRNYILILSEQLIIQTVITGVVIKTKTCVATLYYKTGQLDAFKSGQDGVSYNAIFKGN